MSEEAKVKSVLQIRPHSLLSDANVVAIWYGDELIATATGADGPGLRVISRYPLEIGKVEKTPTFLMNLTEVRVDLS